MLDLPPPSYGLHSVPRHHHGSCWPWLSPTCRTPLTWTLTSTKSNSRTCSDGATGEPSAHLHITSALRVPRLPERWHLAMCEATKHHINSMLSHQKSWSRWSLMCSRAMLLFLKNSRQKNVSAGFLGLLTNKFHVFILSCLA